MSELWQRCLARLEAQLSAEDVHTYLAPLQGAEEGATLVLWAPNPYTLDAVRERFLLPVQQALQQLAPMPMGVELRLGTRNAAPPREESRSRGGERGEDSKLNAHYTFENFVEGKSNQLGKAAAMQVAQNPGRAYNPLLLYGGTGLGKTHLMHAAGNLMRANRADMKILYLHSEDFVSGMVRALQQKNMDGFKRRFRSVDALLIDDIQFFAGKETTQEEFFHTFNALYTHSKQIILASDRHPRELVTLEDRLRSRFAGGLVMDIQPPEYETRVAIIESWAQERAVRVPRSVSELLAARASGNIRELEGMFTQLVAQVQLSAQPVTLALAESALALYDRPRQHRRPVVTLEQIISATAAHHALAAKDLTGKRRAARINHARQVAMYLARELTDLSLPQIGAGLGGRSHTTILHGYNKVADLMTEDALFRQELAALRDGLAHDGGASLGASPAAPVPAAAESRPAPRARGG